MPKKVDRNKKNHRTKEDSLALPYEAARAFNATGDETDPLGSYTGTPSSGRNTQNNTAENSRRNGDTSNSRRNGDTSSSRRNGDTSNEAQNISVPPQRPPQGDIRFPGFGTTFPIDEKPQPGIPGGKTYLNVKSTDAEAPVQDADDL